jgi:hypothetical protein
VYYRAINGEEVYENPIEIPNNSPTTTFYGGEQERKRELGATDGT